MNTPPTSRRRDLEAWLPKLKPVGRIAGHDAAPGAARRRHFTPGAPDSARGERVCRPARGNQPLDVCQRLADERGSTVRSTNGENSRLMCGPRSSLSPASGGKVRSRIFL